MENCKIEIVSGVSKKTGREYTAVKISIGEWSRLVFPNGNIELDYIRTQLEG